MEELLKGALDEGEKILWKGQPESFETLDKTHRSGYIRKCVITAVITAAILIAYIAAATSNGAGIKWGVIVIILVCAAYACLSPILTANQLRKQIMYVITDKRMMIIRGSVTSCAYDKIGIAAMRKDSDGHSCLICGADGIKLKPTKWRGDTVTGARSDVQTGECSSLVMYAVPEADKVREILKPYLTLN